MKKGCIFILIFFAQSVLALGNFIGIPYGKPFPSGTYFVNTPYYLSSPSSKQIPSTNIIFNSTSFTYVPKYKILKGVPVIGGSLPEAFIRNQGKHAWVGNLVNPSLGAGLQWEFTPHLGFANILSIYAPMNTQGASIDAWSFAERSSITYFSPDAQGTVHFFYSFYGDSQTSCKPKPADLLTLDFTYQRLFNQLSIGPIAYGGWDTTLANPKSVFAVGGLIGYHFRDFSLQFWLARDTNSNQFGNYSTTGFLRILVVLDKKSSYTERTFSSLY